MINEKTQLRELCYAVKIDTIEPIVGSDNCEAAVIGGWKCMVRRGTFEAGGVGIYFEIDSLVDVSKPEFAFLAKKHGRIKTQKYTFGGKNPGFYSQGLLMSAEDFGWTIAIEPIGGARTEVIIDDEGKPHYYDDESRFLTEKLGVTYYVAEDNLRKAPKVDKYKKMAQRVGKKANTPWWKWLYRREWGKRVLFTFYGNKADKKKWPQWVKKTDEERIECCTFYLNDKMPWIASEKLDGTSTTFTLKRGKWPRKNEFYVCSRNVVFDKPDKQCYYENNVYLEMASKYDMEAKMTDMLQKHPEWDWVTLQGETYGGGPLGNIQKNTYDLDEHRLAIFNLVTSDRGRWNSVDMVKYLKGYDIPCVPILSEALVLPPTVEELRAFVHSAPSTINGKMKEGIVFRSLDGVHSFKCVDPEYLTHWHQ